MPETPTNQDDLQQSLLGQYEALAEELEQYKQSRSREQRRWLSVSVLLVGLLVMGAAVRIKGNDLEIWPIGASHPTSSYKLKFIGTDSTSAQRLMGLENKSTASGYRLAISDNAGVEKVTVTSDGKLGIGVTSPAASALLDVVSTEQGLLLPRLTTTQMDAISPPSAGLLIYNTTQKSLSFYDGTTWLSTGGTVVP